VDSGLCTVASDAMCIRSPNYPSAYNNNDNCAITVTAHEQVTLSVTAFDLESDSDASDSSCSYDSLTVNSNKYCSTSGPDGVQVAAGASITFTSDGSFTRPGFEICGTFPTGRGSILSCCSVCPAKPHLGVSRASSLRMTQCGGVNRSKPASVSVSPAFASSSSSIAYSDSSVSSWCVVPSHDTMHAERAGGSKTAESILTRCTAH
jgi:hypothetical protein